MGTPERMNTKTKNEINSLNKNDLAVYATKMTAAYKSLYDKLFDQNNGIIVKLENQVQVSSQVSAILVEKIAVLERRLQSTEQYTRKESIEFKGFNTEIPDAEMEKNVIGVLNEIKGDDEEEYTGEDIQACHKLKNKNLVICKFVSRKRMRAVVNNRKKLKDRDMKKHGVKGKLVIFESMSPHFKNLNWRCKQLTKAGYIKDCWFYNGKYNILTKEEERKNIVLVDDLYEILKLNELKLNKICE